LYGLDDNRQRMLGERLLASAEPDGLDRRLQKSEAGDHSA